MHKTNFFSGLQTQTWLNENENITAPWLCCDLVWLYHVLFWGQDNTPGSNLLFSLVESPSETCKKGKCEDKYSKQNRQNPLKVA